MKDRELRKLYGEIPRFTCKAGCTGCCGPVPWAAVEWERVKAEAPLTTLLHDLGEGAVLAQSGTDGMCPFRGESGCKVYDRRPFMCRLFGTANDPRLICPFGSRPKHLHSAEWARRLLGRYHLAGGGPTPSHRAPAGRPSAIATTPDHQGDP